MRQIVMGEMCLRNVYQTLVLALLFPIIILVGKKKPSFAPFHRFLWCLVLSSWWSDCECPLTPSKLLYKYNPNKIHSTFTLFQSQTCSWGIWFMADGKQITPPHLPDLLCLASARSSVWLQITHAEVVTFLGCHLMFMYKHNWWVAVALLAFPRESVTCPSQLFFEGWRREDQTLVCTKDFKPAGVTAQNNNNTLNSCKAFHPVIPKHFPLLNP